MTGSVARWAAILVASASVPGDGAPVVEEAVAFTVATMPMSGADGVPVFVLDGAGRVADRLTADLPAGRAEAEAEVRRRVAAGGAEAIRTAAEGGRLAARLGVTRLPAVVVDGRFVVYGVTDMGRALDLVARWRAGERASGVAGASHRTTSVRAGRRVERR